MDKQPCPPWCIPAYCTIDRPPINGFQVGAHRGPPTAIEVLRLQLVQAVDAPSPSVELRLGDARMRVPLLVAPQVGPTIDDLLEAAGVGL